MNKYKPVARLAACLALAFFLLAGGCLTKTVTVKSYDQAVSDYGQPDNCNVKPNGDKYCSWIQSRAGTNYRYNLIMVFDKKGKLIKSYTQSQFGDNTE